MSVNSSGKFLFIRTVRQKNEQYNNFLSIPETPFRKNSLPVTVQKNIKSRKNGFLTVLVFNSGLLSASLFHPFLVIKNPFSQTDALGRYLEKLIIFKKFQRLLKAHLFRRHEP